jgi:hypothetical protein
MKKFAPYVLVLIWFLVIGLLAFLLTGCKNKNKIEPGDKVVKCVIDSVSTEGPRSTIEPYVRYYYYTKCGERLITNRDDIYKIGDTITYVYKK